MRRQPGKPRWKRRWASV
uniref:Uncharacterized protein n=1 Tax=Arundo donax TaxID=35708 RepID=A0A0A9AEM6_ARUDO